MRMSIICFCICWPVFSILGQRFPEKRLLTVEGAAEQAIRADEIYYSLTALHKTARALQRLDAYLAADSLGLMPRKAAPQQNAVFPPAPACEQADSVLANWLNVHAAEVELVEQDLYDEIGIPAAANRTLLKIKNPAAFRSLLVRLETCPCFVGELVRVGYSRPEALQHQLTLDALRDAKRKAAEMLALFGSRVKAVYHIAPARADWTEASLTTAEYWSPFDPKLNRSLELRCRVQITVQFRYK